MKFTETEEVLAAEWIKNRDPQRPSFGWSIQYAQDPEVYRKAALAEAFIAGLRAAKAEK